MREAPLRTGWAAWPPLLTAWGPGGASDMHAHHAIQLVFARSGTLFVATPDRGAFRAAGLVTAPDAPHAVDARGREVVMAFVDPESDVGAKLLPRGARTRTISARLRNALLRDFDVDAPASVARVLARLGADERRRRVHPGVRRVLAYLGGARAPSDMSLAALARLARVSESRLVHAFTESIGIPLRAFLLWRKVQRAVLGLAGAASLAVVAYDAGFADAAHMSRTFRRMLGVSPSTLRRFVGKARTL